jgi:hypothetical protein
MQDDCAPPQLAEALVRLLSEPDVMAAQRRALARVPGLMQLASDTPSEAAARIVLSYATSAAARQ